MEVRSRRKEGKEGQAEGSPAAAIRTGAGAGVLQELRSSVTIATAQAAQGC